MIREISTLIAAGSVVHAWLKAADNAGAAKATLTIDGNEIAVWASREPGFRFVTFTAEKWGELCIAWDDVDTELSAIYAFDPQTVLDDGIRLLLTSVSNAFPAPAPQLHFRPPFGWMNDPNGLSFFDGRYHLFYQHYPHSLRWGPMHWGHAVSRDMIHWTHCPVFLLPEADVAADAKAKGGCFSGSAIPLPSGDGLRVYFTEHQSHGDGDMERQRSAVTRDLITPQSLAEVPLERPVESAGRGDFRDPYAFQGPDGRWKMLLGTRDKSAAIVLLYDSADGQAVDGWQLVGRLFEDDLHGAAPAECPCMIEVPDADHPERSRWVLIYAVLTSRDKATARRNLTYAVVGDFDGRQFTPIKTQELDFATDCYAFQALQSQDGPRGIGWLANWTDFSKDADFPTTMTLPRRLLLKGGELHTPPIPELAGLRGAVLAQGAPAIGETLQLPDAPIELSLDLAQTGSSVEIVFGHEALELAVKTSADGLEIHYREPGQGTAPRYIAAQAAPKNLRIFLDRGAIEVFADDGRWVGSKRLASTAPVTSVRLLAKAGDVARADIWRLDMQNTKR
ncbi:MAG: GH32 C-terminal domain-containing protein [Propionivibrio sp.]